MSNIFDLVEEKEISLLGINAEVYRHQNFGSKHIHLKSESDEKSFLVAFRTIPKDSSGVAHILEHTVLCGSKRFPVRDPFFMMIRRSLSTFMNAMTSQDTTMYPFATLNDQDFKNLLDVYLDATFFPNLNELDFMQEGHRLEIKRNETGDEKLVLKGVVFNEMKGAMSSVSSQLYQGLSEFLYPETTYKYNSGGDPLKIPDLTYEDLLKFHKKHYHPSNALFMSHGNIDPEFLQEEIQLKVLDKFEPRKDDIRVKSETPLVKPIYCGKPYKPFADDVKNHHVVISWLMPETKDPVDHLALELIESILLENSASPLRKALENSTLGKSPASILGLSTSNKQMFFIAGLEGVDANKNKDVEALVLGTISQIVSQGISKESLESSLHQIELSQKIIGGRMPYGLNILLGAMQYALDDCDTLKFLDVETSLIKLKQRLKESGYLEKLLSDLFLKNNHRVTFELFPDLELDEKKEKAEKNYLSDRLLQLNDSDKDLIESLTKKLEDRQNSKDDESLLPCVRVSDIKKEKKYPTHIKSLDNGVVNYHYKASTNGIDYLRHLYAMKDIKLSDLLYSDFFSFIVTEVGILQSSYEKVQNKQSATLGDINFKFFMPDNNDLGNLIGAELGGYSLNKNTGKMEDLICDTAQGFRLDEKERINELAKMYLAGRERSVTQSGHLLAMSNASSQCSEKGAIIEKMSGLSSISNFKKLMKQSGDVDIDKLISFLAEIREKIINQPKIKVYVTAQDINLSDSSDHFSGLEDFSILKDVKLNDSDTAWITESGVNYCAQVLRTVDYSHPDSPALTVLGRILHNGYLHSAIREKGGAYGSGAIQDLSTGLFKFFSYRDPNVEETFDAFEKSIQWVRESLSKSHVEQGVLGVISAIDKPPSPSMEAISDLYAKLAGRSAEKRKNFRSKIIECSTDNIIEVVERYLLKKPSRSVVSSEKFTSRLNSMGFSVTGL